MFKAEPKLAPEPVEHPDTGPTPARTAAHPRPRTLPEIIAAQLKSLEQHHRETLETGGVEAIHKARVTTRRLQASLDLLQTNGDQIGIRRIKRQLRKWRRRLSLVRNYDVFLEVIDRATRGRNRLRREQLDLLKSELQKRRDQLMDENRPFLAQISVERLAARLPLKYSSRKYEAPAEEPDSTRQPTRPALVVSPEGGFPEIDQIKLRASGRLEQRTGEFMSLAAQSHPSADPRDLHQLRIAAKRLRYLLEVLSDMGYGDASRALGWLKRLQERIGEWHDLEALEIEIVDIVRRRKFMREHFVQCSRILNAAAAVQRRKEAQVARVFPVTAPTSLPATSHRFVRSLRPYKRRRLTKKPAQTGPTIDLVKNPTVPETE